MLSRGFFIAVLTFMGVLCVLFIGGESVNAQDLSRADVMRQITARSDVFRQTAGRLGWDETSARQILTDGWDRLTNPERETVISEGTDAEFMLNALESLDDCEAVDRACAFVLEECGREISAVALADQFRRAALGSPFEEEESEAALDVLARWSADSAEWFLLSVNESRKPAPVPFDREDVPSVALASSASSANDFQSFLALNLSTRNPLDGLCVTQDARLPRITFFSLNFALSAGRKSFLLI